MATSNWKKVKVKVKGKMVTRWTDGKTFRLYKPGALYPEGLPNILRGLKGQADAANTRQRERDFGSSSSSSSSSKPPKTPPTNPPNNAASNTVPAGSMNISAAGRKQAEANKEAAKAKRLKAEAAAKAAADKKAAAAKAAADKKALLAKQNSQAPTPSSAAQNLRSGRSPDRAPSKPAATTPKTTRTWLKDNYKSGGPAKEALKVKPKKKRLTNKQRKQGGFH